MPRLTLLEAVALLEEDTEVTLKWDGNTENLTIQMLARLAERTVAGIAPQDDTAVTIALAAGALLPVSPFAAVSGCKC